MTLPEPTLPIAQGALEPLDRGESPEMLRSENMERRDPIYLAPMCGITDYAFRRLVKEFGCPHVFTEMISAEGLLAKRGAMLKIAKEEHPVSVQLFGANANRMAEAASLAEETGADAVNINLGCPAPRATQWGAGAALMQFPEKVEEILLEVRRVIRCPLTIKIRSGWDSAHINAVEISRIAEGCGADGIFLHPRTRAQGFQGRADWGLIGEVKRAVKVPVIGNGDIVTPLLAKKMREETGCDGVMVGRGALGNPWIFSPAGEWSGPPSARERERAVERHFSILQDHYGDEKAVREIRKHAAWYARGLPSSASFRVGLQGIKEKEALLEFIRSFLSDDHSRRSFIRA